MPELQSILIDGLPVANLTRDEALHMFESLLSSKRQHMVCFLNAETVVLAHHNKEFRKILLGASLRLVDGAGMQWAANLQGRKFLDNLNGTDLFPYICRLLEKNGNRIFLLGSKRGVARKAGEWIRTRYKNVRIAGTHDGYFSKQDESDVIKLIHDTKPDVLFVGMGSPYQEVWIYNHLKQTGAKIAMGVGGLFDYYSDSIMRAPIWMRKMCIEWLWRWLVEPWRWKRMLRLIEFIWIIFVNKR